jgi:putative two-component system response regulator
MLDLKKRFEQRILVVDDEQANVDILVRMLGREGYTEVTGLVDPKQAVTHIESAHLDLVVLDLSMPGLDGFQVMRKIRSARPSEFLPILVITGETGTEAKRRALSSGATDFLTKPFDSVEVLLRVHNLLETRDLYRTIEQQKRLIQETLDQRVRELNALNRFIEPFLSRRVESEDMFGWLNRELSEANRRISGFIEDAEQRRAMLGAKSSVPA